MGKYYDLKKLGKAGDVFYFRIEKPKFTAFIFDRRVMDNIGMFEIINPIPALYLYKNGKLCMQVEGDKQDLLRIKKQWEDRNI